MTRPLPLPLRVLLVLGLTGPLATGQLAISEYVEGSAFNQAVEVYNFSQAPVDLGRFRIDLYRDGSATRSATIALEARTLLPREVWVVAHSSIDPSVLPQVDQLTTALVFDGDDVVVLRAPWGTADAVGEIGVDPGTHWGTGTTVTRDATLVRELYDCADPYLGVGSFTPADAWAGLPADDFSRLGTAPFQLQLDDCTLARATYRNPSTWGTVNPAVYMVSSLPVLGSKFTATIDTTGKQGAYLVGFQSPLKRLTTWGNILVDYTQPPGELLGMIWGVSNPVVIERDIPLSPALAGVTICTQAVRFGNGVDLTNAQDLRFGY